MRKLKPLLLVLTCLLLLASYSEEYVLMSSMPAAAAAPPDATVIVDFDVAVDPPLVKKFDFMNSGIVPMWRYRRDLELIEDLRSRRCASTCFGASRRSTAGSMKW